MVISVRDSKDEAINVTLWMRENTAQDWDQNYKIGDVIEMSNVRVQSKEPGNTERYFVKLYHF